MDLTQRPASGARPGKGTPCRPPKPPSRPPNPGRYLAQLCKHASKMGGHLRHRPRSHDGGAEPPEIRRAEWSQTDGIITLSWGQWTMHAAPGRLTLRAAADSAEDLRHIQDLVTARLEKVGQARPPDGDLAAF